MQVSLSTILSITALVFLFNLILAVVLVLFERRNPISTLVWLMVIFFIPVFGFIFYLFLGQDLRKRKIFFLKSEEEDELLSSVQQQKDLLKQKEFLFHEEPAEKFKEMIYFHLVSGGAAYTQDNQVTIFNEGKALFQDLKEILNQAKKFIHLQFYIIRNDQLGQEIVSILTEKARQGVEVKFLYDGMGSIKLPKNFFQPLLEAGGKTAIFYPPFLPYINLRMNYRNHRKICVVDGKTGYVGGFNIGNEYLGLSERFGHWRDMHLKIVGSAVSRLEFRFLLDWRFASGEDLLQRQDYFLPEMGPGQTGMQIVTSGPDSRWPAIRSGYFKMINNAVDHVYIESPYFIPDNNILNALKTAALSGVDVKIILPDKPDHYLVYWATLSYMGELLEAGVRFFNYRNGFIHSKMITVDGEVSSVGTANVDIRSFKVNFEVNAFVYDREIARQLEDLFAEDIRDSVEMTSEIYEQRSMMTKTKEQVARLLSPLL